jgi:hypothetical protein
MYHETFLQSSLEYLRRFISSEDIVQASGLQLKVDLIKDRYIFNLVCRDQDLDLKSLLYVEYT